MTLDAHKLQALAVQVRGLVDQVVRLFGGADDTTAAVDAPTAVEPHEGASTASGWSHIVRVPVPPDALDRLEGPVRDLLVGEGFEEVDRDDAAQIARQFRSPSGPGPHADLGVHLARSGRGDVVIGASASG